MMATGSNSAGPSNVDIQPVIEAPVEGAMAVYGGRPAPVNQDIEVLDCHGCTMGSHQFWVEYGGKMERVIKLCQDHGVILKTKNCIKCGEVCRYFKEANSRFHLFLVTAGILYPPTP